MGHHGDSGSTDEIPWEIDSLVVVTYHSKAIYDGQSPSMRMFSAGFRDVLSVAFRLPGARSVQANAFLKTISRQYRAAVCHNSLISSNTFIHMIKLHSLTNEEGLIEQPRALCYSCIEIK